MVFDVSNVSNIVHRKTSLDICSMFCMFFYVYLIWPMLPAGLGSDVFRCFRCFESRASKKTYLHVFDVFIMFFHVYLIWPMLPAGLGSDVFRCFRCFEHKTHKKHLEMFSMFLMFFLVFILSGSCCLRV